MSTHHPSGDSQQRWQALVRARLGSLSAYNIDPAREVDIVAELAQHVAEHHAELVAAGVPYAEAERRALAPLDAPDPLHSLRAGPSRSLAREIARADRPRPVAPPPPPAGGSVLQNIGRDVRYAIRLLRRAPGFTAAA